MTVPRGQKYRFESQRARSSIFGERSGSLSITSETGFKRIGFPFAVRGGGPNDVAMHQATTMRFETPRGT